MKNKIFSWVIVIALVILPQVVFAADFDWGISTGGSGWSVSVGSGSGGIGGTGGSYGLPGGSILGIIQAVLFWILGVLSMVSLIGFAVAGILYLTAAGDETRIGIAKKAMTFSIIGVIVGLSGFVVLQAATYMLNAQSF